MPVGGEDIALARRRYQRNRELEIEKICASWQCEEYRKLLEQSLGGDVGLLLAAATGSASDSSSQPVPAIPSGPPSLQQQQVVSNVVVRQDDVDRERHERDPTPSTGSSRTSSAPPQPVPPEIALRSNLGPQNAEGFIGTIAALCADNSPRHRSAIFRAVGLCDYRLAPPEAAWATKTPDISWSKFNRLFGGHLYSDRPIITRKTSAYVGSLIFCADIFKQPFTPMRVGEPGLIFFPPGKVLLEDTQETFHLLVDRSRGKRSKLLYCGTYTKVHTTPYLMEVQPDEWHALPQRCRRDWFKILLRAKADVLHARCNLRMRHGFEPSQPEVEEWLRNYADGSEAMQKRAIPRGFNSGAEKMGFELIKCVGYDVNFARLIMTQN